jgi:hypothetical protein
VIARRSPLPLLVSVALAGALVAACGGSKEPAAPPNPSPPTPCQSVTECPAVACQIASCTGGACAYADAALATTCDDGQGGKLCDGNGSCVECNTDADCQASANVCTTSTACVAHTCNAAFSTGLAPPDKQTPNDCLKILCDPSAPNGLVLNFAPEDVVTTTGNPCTELTCDHAPDPVVAVTALLIHLDDPCTGAGGPGFCNPEGACTECTDPDPARALLQCPASTGECLRPACDTTTWSCGFAPLDPSTACSAGTGHCDGGGTCVVP